MPRQYPPSQTELRAKSSEDPAELAELATHRSSFVRSAVARNPRTSAETIALLIASDDKYVRSAAAQHRNAPAEALSALSDDLGDGLDEYTLRALASNRTTPVETLTRLAACEHASVRAAVAKNSAAPVDVLRLLAGGASYETACNLAWNPRTPDDVLALLARSRDANVVHKLASRKAYLNTETRPQAVTRFNGRSHHTAIVDVPVERGGRFSPEVIEAFATSAHLTLHRTAASQPDAPASVLHTLAGHEDQWVRVRVAENPAASDEALLALVEAGPSEVVIAVAGRPGLSDAVMEAVALSRSGHAHERLCAQSGMMARLMTDPAPKVRAVAAKYGHLLFVDPWNDFLADPDESVRQAGAAAMPLRALEAQVAHPCKKVRQVLAQRSDTPGVLARLAADEAVVVRRRVAANRHVDASTLSLLAADGDRRTRRAASERFLNALAGLT